MTSIPGLINWGAACMSLISMALIFRSLSRRLGEALRIKKYYLLYDACIVMLIVAMASIAAEYVGLAPDHGPAAAASRLLFLAGALLIVGTTVRYWAWAIPEVLGSLRK
jgi:hypothetical protein